MTKRKIEQKYLINDNGCWIWQLTKCANGRYGYVRYHHRMRLAHIVYYIEKYGPIPVGMELDHTCRNTLCVNPDHLEPVTHEENIRRHHSYKCKNGHIRTPENSIKTKTGVKCKTCNDLWLKLKQASRHNYVHPQPHQ